MLVGNIHIQSHFYTKKIQISAPWQPLAKNDPFPLDTPYLGLCGLYQSFIPGAHNTNMAFFVHRSLLFLLASLWASGSEAFSVLGEARRGRLPPACEREGSPSMYSVVVYRTRVSTSCRVVDVCVLLLLPIAVQRRVLLLPSREGRGSPWILRYPPHFGLALGEEEEEEGVSRSIDRKDKRVFDRGNFIALPPPISFSLSFLKYKGEKGVIKGDLR